MAEIANRSERDEARGLYWQGFKISEIAQKLNLPRTTVDSWRKRDRWDNASVTTRTNAAVHERLCQIIMVPDKSASLLQEMGMLQKILESNARIKNYEKTGRAGDLNPKLDNRNRGKKSRKKSNDLTEEHIEALRADFEKTTFTFQKEWEKQRYKQRRRAILKSRQIGATWYFAREAFLNAAETGDNQIFLSASKNQALIFRGYIVEWVKNVTEVELKGETIRLAHNDAELSFLGTNSDTAQGYHGHIYVDEFFWIPKFKHFKKVVSAMASQKKWTQTYISTPSAISHEAYGFWSGKDFNRGKAKEDQADFDISHKNLKDGKKGPDGLWRQIVTILDAEAGGCDLFDIADLKLEYTEEAFLNLFMCVFMDDHISYFKLALLEKCLTDIFGLWDDYNPFEERPLGNKPVYIGYDPSRSKDDACIVVVAPPCDDYKYYRVIEKISFRDRSFQDQAEALQSLCQRYNVTYMGIDVTGIGMGVFEMVTDFFPTADSIQYNPQVKTMMVLKAKQLMEKSSLKWDTGLSSMTQSFMQIRQTMTASGAKSTFVADRSAETGHADEAWALMHAVGHEGLATVNSTIPKNKQKAKWKII